MFLKGMFCSPIIWESQLAIIITLSTYTLLARRHVLVYSYLVTTSNTSPLYNSEYLSRFLQCSIVVILYSTYYLILIPIITVTLLWLTSNTYRSVSDLDFPFT